MAKKKIPNIVKQVTSKIIPNVDFSTEKIISHSQITIYDKCPYRWKLQYKDKLKPFSDSINTIFGKAIHEVIQKYLDIMYKHSKVSADNLDLHEMYKEIFKEEYKKSYKSNKNSHFSDPDEMMEFSEDAFQILDYFKKNVSKYFGKRGWHFIGYELPINMSPQKSHPGIKYYGFLDLVFYNELSETFKIVDIKTSKNSWGKYQKGDFMKKSQLLLYKKYFSEQYGVPIEQIEVEFMILKRKLWEDLDFHQKRFQIFSPADGKNSINKASKMVDDFIVGNFNQDNTIIEKKYPKKPSESNCRFCPFLNDSKNCDKSIF